MREEIEKEGGIKLIYIDPPFDVGADFSMDVEVGEGSYEKKPNVLEQFAYRDTWGMGQDSFLSMIYERLNLIRDLMSDDGTIYLHCDWRVNVYMRNVLEEVYGKENYRASISWQKIRTTKRQSSSFGNVLDTIFVYSKSDQFTYNQQHKPHDPKYIKSH